MVMAAMNVEIPPSPASAPETPGVKRSDSRGMKPAFPVMRRGSSNESSATLVGEPPRTPKTPKDPKKRQLKVVNE